MHRFLMSFVIGLCLCGPASSASMVFDIVARIDGAFLRGAGETAKVPVGGVLNGKMTYSFPPSQQFGSDYHYSPGLETLSISTPGGFSLTLDNRVTHLYSDSVLDVFLAQSFISEDPNGWNMLFEVNTTGWLGGKTDLPTAFPDSFDSAYIQAYFTDEGDWVQTVEATILSIKPEGESVSVVPLPPAGALLGGMVIIVFGRAHYRRRRTSTAGERLGRA